MKFENYIIITNTLSYLGGAELYTLRRTRYLIERGLKVTIVVRNNENFLLAKHFEGISIFVVENLGVNFFISSKKEKSEILNAFKKSCLPVSSKVIIESHTPELAYWGEYVASQFNCKHLIYFLSEPKLSKSYFYKFFLKFFYFKLERNELLGITNISLNESFGKAVKPNNFVNVPFDRNEVEIVSVPSIRSFLANNKVNLSSETVVISTISRLEKHYIFELIREVMEISLHRKNRIVLLIVGDSKDQGLLTKLKEASKNDNCNLSIYFLGYVYPVGKDFFEITNIFVGMGTAAINSISQGCATITVDPNTSQATGILGLNNSNFAYSESGESYKISDLINKLLDDSSLIDNARKSGLELFETNFDEIICMTKLDSFITIENDSKYFDLDEINSFRVKLILNLGFLYVKLHSFKNWFRF